MQVWIDKGEALPVGPRGACDIRSGYFCNGYRGQPYDDGTKRAALAHNVANHGFDSKVAPTDSPTATYSKTGFMPNRGPLPSYSAGTYDGNEASMVPWIADYRAGAVCLYLLSCRRFACVFCQHHLPQPPAKPVLRCTFSLRLLAARPPMSHMGRWQM